MKKLACLVSVLTLMGLANSGLAYIQDTRPTVPEDAAIFDVAFVHDVTDYYSIPEYDFEQYLAQDPGGKIRGIAYATDMGMLVELSVTGSISGGPSPKPVVVKLTYKALAVTAGNECESSVCWVPASGSLKATLTVVSCTSIPCVGDVTSGYVVLDGTVSGTLKANGQSIRVSESVSLIGATERNLASPEVFAATLYPPIIDMANAPKICTARIAIDVYPTAVKYNCTTIQSMKYNAIGYVSFDSGINDIVTGSGTFDYVKGSKFTVGNCYGKVTITIARAVDPCDVCNYYNVATVTGKLAGQGVNYVVSFLVNPEYVDEYDQFLFWPNVIYKPIGLSTQ